MYQDAAVILILLYPRDGRWYYYSAQANSGAGNTATALEHAKHAVEIDPDNVAYQNLYRQLQSGMLKDAKTIIALQHVLLKNSRYHAK